MEMFYGKPIDRPIETVDKKVIEKINKKSSALKKSMKIASCLSKVRG